jgi:hypothetical protein
MKSYFDSGIRANISHESPKYSAVQIIGDMSPEDVKKSAQIYIDLLAEGAKRLLIDLTEANGDLKMLMSAHEDLNKGLSKYDRVGIVIASAKNSFAVKAAAANDSNIQVFYERNAAQKWLAG